MVVVSLIVGLICYFLCCLTQLKASLKEYRMKQSFKQNQKLHKQQQRLASKTSSVNVSDSTNGKLSEAKSSTSDIKTINLHINTLNSQKNRIYQPVENDKIIKTQEDSVKKFDRNSLHLKLASNNNEILEEQINLKRYSENSEPNSECILNSSGKKPIKKDLESELEPLVVMELDESPKSIYFRLKQIGFQSKDNIDESEKDIDKEVLEINCKRLSSIRIKSIDSLEEDSNTYFSTDQPRGIYENLNSIIRIRNESDKKLYLSDSNYKYRKKTKKKFFKFNTDQEDQQTTPTNTSFKSTSNDEMEDNAGNKRAKLIILKKRSKDTLNSDIEIEEDMICDGDSLSSTGINCEHVIDNTSVNNMKSTFKSSENVSNAKTSDLNNESSNKNDMFTSNSAWMNTKLEITTSKLTSSLDKSQEPIGKQSEAGINVHRTPLLRTTNKDSKHGELTKMKNSSMSDIEPDENLLKNLLLKNPSSS